MFDDRPSSSGGENGRIHRNKYRRNDLGIVRIVQFLFFFTLFSLFLSSLPLHAAPSMSMELAFRGRGWRTIDRLYSSKEAKKGEAALSSKDLSLYANALWMQGRYAESVKILESAKPEYPKAVEPYARMLLVLGLERTGRKEKALIEGKKLWDRAPHSLQYYLSYCLGRLTRDLAMQDESFAWFQKMSDLAPNKRLRLNALQQLVRSDRADEDAAALLLMESPSDEKALAICSAVPKGRNAKVEYALGLYFQINRKHAEAISRFELASNDIAFKEAARYHCALSMFRSGKPDAAFSLWSHIAEEGSEFPQRALQRIIAMASEENKSEILLLSRKIADKRKDLPELAADALLGIARLAEKEEANAAESELIERYPSSNQHATARWEKGWRAWRNRDYRTAAFEWSKGYSKEIKNVELASRLLYWRGKALDRMGEKRETIERIESELLSRYPGEYYAFLVSSDGGIVNGPVPDRYIKRSVLEDWGFITYARLETTRTYSENASPSSLYTGVRLALWENDFASAVRDFSLLQQVMTKDESVSSELLKRAYPRAFEPDVLFASRKTGIESSILWGIMRRESQYEPYITGTSGEYGLMQLMPGTANEEIQKLRLPPGSHKTISGNILIGANYLAGLLSRFKELPKALAAYNAGGAPARRWDREPAQDMAEWVENIGYPQTRSYVKAVLKNIAMYRILYDRR